MTAMATETPWSSPLPRPGGAIQRFGRARANVVFGWVFAGHQLGAALAAYDAGLTRTVWGTYLPAFFSSGVLCLIAALLIITVRKDPQSAAQPA